MKKYKLALIGSRTFVDYEYFKKTVLYYYRPEQIACVVSGGANGADKLAESFANEFDLPLNVYKADWKRLKLRAGYERNITLIENSDCVIAFWDQVSNGTKHSIGLARKSNLPIVVVDTNERIPLNYFS